MSSRAGRRSRDISPRTAACSPRTASCSPPPVMSSSPPPVAGASSAPVAVAPSAPVPVAPSAPVAVAPSAPVPVPSSAPVPVPGAVPGALAMVALLRGVMAFYQRRERYPGVRYVLRAHPVNETGVHPLDRRPDHGRRGMPPVGEADRQPPAVLGVDRPVQVTAHDQGVDELPGGLLGHPEFPDDLAERSPGTGDGANHVAAITRHVVAARFGPRLPDRGAVGRPGPPQQRRECHLVKPVLVLGHDPTL